jgi:hypothetical protein
MRNLKLLTKLALGSALCGLTFIPLAAFAENFNPIEILSDSAVSAQNRLPDFSYAGYNHGIGDIPTLKGRTIDVTKYGVIADDEKDDSLALLEALDAAHKVRGPVIVKFPKGKVIISEVLKITRGDIAHIFEKI